MPSRIRRPPARLIAAILILGLVLATAPAGPGAAQGEPAGPPSVGVIRVERRPVTQSDEFTGRVQAINRVDLVARVSAFLNERLFTEGAEVTEGVLLYRLERAPYEAEVAARQATVAQARAELANARLALSRAQDLRATGAGTQVALDNATAQERSAVAQLEAAQAQVRQAEINLGYTEIRSPIAGRIGSTSVTIGNVVGPNSGTLATIVSQDPMHVTFPIAMPTALALRDRYADKGGFRAVAIKLRLSDGRLYGQVGQLNFVGIDVAQDTDTLPLRAVIANPLLGKQEIGGSQLRELTNGEFVTVILEAVEPVEALVIPRDAVLSDQQGDFVYVVGSDNRVQRRNVQLGPSTSAVTAVVAEGLKEGDSVVLEGVQRVQPNMVVSPSPAAAGAEAEAGSQASGR